MYATRFCRVGNALLRQGLHRYNVAINTPLVSRSHHSYYSSKILAHPKRHQEFSTEAYAKMPTSVSRLTWVKSKVKVYLELAKYKLSALVVVTSGAGFISAGALDSTIVTACIGKTIFSMYCIYSFFNRIKRDRTMCRRGGHIQSVHRKR